jgi:hypothetical protein
MWKWFRKRQDGDLRRLTSAYRCFLKAVHQNADYHLLDEEEKQKRYWKGGFGKAFNQLFLEWPTPSESSQFEKVMHRWLKKGKDTDEAFILAFNDYLKQKRLDPQELHEILNQGKREFQGSPLS